MGEQTGAVNLTAGSTWKNIWHMSWSMLLVMFFNFLVGLTDIYVAGFIGPEVQAVVGFVSELYFFIIIVANAISIGTVALVSRAVGAGNIDDARSAARQSLFFVVICAIALSAAGLLFHEKIISIASFPEDVRRITGEFFTIYALALLPNCIVIVSNAIFRAGAARAQAAVALFTLRDDVPVAATP